jgi:hypothetical protein
VNWGRLPAAEAALEEEVGEVVVVVAGLLAVVAKTSAVTVWQLLQRETMRPTCPLSPAQRMLLLTQLMNPLMAEKMRWKIWIGTVTRVQEHGHEGVEGGVGWRQEQEGGGEGEVQVE